MKANDYKKLTQAESAILIPSCDKYADIWPVFFSCFWKFWPDCPFKIYLGSNEKCWDDERVSNITIGPDGSWTNNLGKYLDKINQSKIIMILDDFLLTDFVDTKKILELIETADQIDADCVRLKPSPPPSRQFKNSIIFGEILPGEPYRISTQVAIWDVNYLRRISRYDLTIWEFEEIGSLLSDRIEGLILCVFEPVVFYTHCIERGKWRNISLRYLDNQGIELPPGSSRGVEGEKKLPRFSIITLYVAIIKLLPRSVRRFLRRIKPRPELKNYK